jgi:hypothetical protein
MPLFTKELVRAYWSGRIYQARATAANVRNAPADCLIHPGPLRGGDSARPDAKRGSVSALGRQVATHDGADKGSK